MNTPTTTPVWDPLVRLFHWLLVSAFLISWLTQEEYYNMHLQSGYATLGLVCFRIVWGMLGTQHARFNDFIYSPAAIYAYMKSLRAGKAKRFIGHNPAGGAMVIVLLIGLLTVSISGIARDGAENWSGPMAEMNLYRHAELIQSIHVLSTDLLLVMVAFHLLGVFHASMANRENLVRAMITGRKRAD